MKDVLSRPDTKSGSLRMRKCSGIEVLIPSTTVISSARRIRAIVHDDLRRARPTLDDRRGFFEQTARWLALRSHLQQSRPSIQTGGSEVDERPARAAAGIRVTDYVQRGGREHAVLRL